MRYFLEKSYKDTGLGSASTHFVVFKNTFLSRNLDQNMLKCFNFWKNSVEVSAPKPPLDSGGWGLCPHTPELFLITCYSCFVKHVCSANMCNCASSKKNKSSNSRCSVFSAVLLQPLQFLLKGAQKYFLPGHRVSYLRH